MNKVSVSNTIVSAKKRRLFVTTTALLAAGAFLPANNAKAVDDHADWDNVTIVEGQGTVTDTGLGSTTIDQHSMRAIGEAQELHIGTMGSVRINQTSKNSLFVGRVVGNHSDPTQILGRLSADGRVMIIDRNGVFFGENSVVDAAGIAATTGDVSNADIMDGNENYTFQNFGSGSIELKGTMNVSEAGLAAFVAPNVRNSGVINAKMGKVVFAGGEKVTLDLYGDGLVEVAVDGALGNTLLENKGTIDAEGGTVVMTAESARDVVDNVINNEGVISVGSVTQKGGKIVLSGGKKGKVRNTGTLDASGAQGGDIKVTGQAIELAATSKIKANASAGAAGKVEVIAKDTLAVDGTLHAQGEGKTGFIDTSAPEVTFGEATVIRAGKWLLDPADIIVNAPLATIIEGQLSVGDAELLSPVGGPGDGRIYFRSTVDWSTASTFTVNAYSDIHFDANGGLNATGGGDIVLIANDDIRIFNGSTGVKTAGGDVTLYSGDETTIEDTDGINAFGGNILINNQKGFYGLANTLKTTGNGTITLHQSEDALERPYAGYKARVQNAIDAIHNTGTGQNTLNLREGEFAENLVIDISLKLAALGDVTIEAQDSGEALVKVTASDVNIDPITFDGQNKTHYGVVAQGNGTHGLVVDGNTFKNFKTGGVYIKDTSGGDVSIINNTFLGSMDYGIRTGKLEDGTVLNIQNNKIGSYSNFVDETGIEIGRVTDSTVTIDNDNRIYAKERGISVNRVSGSTVVIDSNKVRSDNDGVKFLGITGGSNVTISDNDISSDDADGIEVESGSSYGTTLGASTLTIANNTIEGEDGYGIKIHNGDLKDGAVINVIDNVSIEGEDGGVYVKDKYFGGVFVNISGNGDGSYGDHGYVPEGGITSSKGHGIELENVITSDIRNNVIHDVGKDGIHIEDFGQSWIAYNHISKTGDDGIDVEDGEFVSIYGNTIVNVGESDIFDIFSIFGKGYGHHDDDGADGIHVANVGGFIPAEMGEGFGYSAYGADSEIFNNDISIVKDDGIEVENSNINYTGHNVIGHVNGDGIAVKKTRATYIVDNVITLALENGIYVDGGEPDYGYDSRGFGFGYGHDYGGDDDSEFGNGIYAGIFGNRILLTGDDGIEVKNINSDPYGYYENVVLGGSGYGDYGWAVNIDGNEVGMTGENGIWAHDSSSVRVHNNDVFAAGMGEALGDSIWIINAFASGAPPLFMLSSAESGFESEHSWCNPSFNWNWGNGDGIRVNDVYGAGPTGEAVDIQHNLVAGTGGHGINVYDAAFARISYNTVLYNGLNTTTIPGFESLQELLSTGPFDDHSGYFNDEEGEEPVFLSLIEDGYGDDDYPSRRDLWSSSDLSLVEILTGHIPFPSEITYDSHDGIHVENVGNYPILMSSFSGPGEYDYDYGYDLPYSVIIQGNTIDHTGDDGIEVLSSGRTLIGGYGFYEGNTITNAGYGVFGGGYGPDETGADGIHVDNVFIGYFGYPTYAGYEAGDSEGPGGYYGYAVDIIGNTVNGTQDDGIEVTNSESTLITGNGLTNIGLGYLLNGREYDQGSDGIHVENVGQSFRMFEAGLAGGEVVDGGIDPYAVLIVGNTIDNTHDDGIEVINSGRTRIGGYGEGEGNTITNVGFGYPDYSTFYAYDYPYYQTYGADGIHVRNVFSNAYGWNNAGVVSEDPSEHFYDVQVIGNTVDKTADDGIQVLFSGDALIAENGLTNIGYLFDGGDVYAPKIYDSEYDYYELAVDFWGADGIHVVAEGEYFPAFAKTQEIAEVPYYPVFGNTTTIIDNVVDTVRDDGIETEGVNQLLIARNTVQDAGDDGINILGYGGYAYEEPDDEYEYEVSLIPIFGGFFNAVIDDNTVDNSGGDGIQSSGYDTLEVTNNEVSNSYYNGLYVSGFYNGYVSMQGNTFIDNGHVEGTEDGDVLVGAGARFESGDIDMSDLTRPNFFVNTTGGKALGMQFDPAEMYGYPDYGYEYAYIFEDSYEPILANLTIVNETLGSTEFEGYAPTGSFYVRFEDGAILDQFGNVIVIDGTDATWDGILPSATGDVITPEQLSFIETRLWDADDPLLNGRGQIFVGTAPSGLDNIQDFFKQFEEGDGRSNGLNVTFLGLPPVGPQSLNDITPAAGEGEGEQNPADIEPAAGEGEGSEQVGCWSDLTNVLGTGKPASLNDDGSAETAMDQAINCGTQQQI